MTRLDRSTALPDGIVPPVQPAGIGIVHIGVGAFHRAHQAVYTQTAMRLSGDLSWGILGVAQHSRRAVHELSAQEGLYSVVTVGDEERVDVIGSILDVVSAPDDPERVFAAIAAPDVQVVTLTVTESAYVSAAEADIALLSSEAEAGQLRMTAAETVVGLLARAIAARQRADAGPLTVISCDNISGNGRLLAGLVTDAIVSAGVSDRARGWIAENVSFPNSVVDRLVPAPTPALRERASALIAARDEGAVLTESFGQWVIEDRFAGKRPPWELAGVVFVDDVAPFEAAKLRLLNGTHSVLAYAGALAGSRTIDEALQDHTAAHAARAYLDDAIAHTQAPEGIDLDAYGRLVMQRFGNAALGHTVEKVAMDGSVKIPQRWGPVVEAALCAGAVPNGAALAVALWSRFLGRCGDMVVDPRQDELVDIAGAPITDVARANAILGSGVLPLPVADDRRFREAVSQAARDLATQGGS